MSRYQAPKTEKWNGRPASSPLYWHQHISLIDLESVREALPPESYVLLGYAVDEGVRRNLGRVGAAAGPDAIRARLGGLSWHFDRKHVYDGGDVFLNGHDLQSAHSLTAEKVAQILNEGGTPILLGGGHDLALAHFRGIKESKHCDRKIGIVNLDAHFDLRKPDNRESTSGTPFHEIKENWPDTKYLVLGIQEPSNNAELFKIAAENKVQFMAAEDFSLNNWTNIELVLSRLVQDVDAIYLTIDLDGFSSAFAPGVSAPSPIGFSPQVVLKVIDFLKASTKLIASDIVECNPVYDVDDRTARLAGHLVYKLIR